MLAPGPMFYVLCVFFSYHPSVSFCSTFGEISSTLTFRAAVDYVFQLLIYLFLNPIFVACI